MKVRKRKRSSSSSTPSKIIEKKTKSRSKSQLKLQVKCDRDHEQEKDGPLATSSLYNCAYCQKFSSKYQGSYSRHLRSCYLKNGIQNSQNMDDEPGNKISSETCHSSKIMVKCETSKRPKTTSFAAATVTVKPKPKISRAEAKIKLDSDQQNKKRRTNTNANGDAGSKTSKNNDDGNQNEINFRAIKCQPCLHCNFGASQLVKLRSHQGKIHSTVAVHKNFQKYKFLENLTVVVDPRELFFICQWCGLECKSIEQCFNHALSVHRSEAASISSPPAV